MNKSVSPASNIPDNKTERWHTLTVEETLARLETQASGLTPTEITRRLASVDAATGAPCHCAGHGD